MQPNAENEYLVPVDDFNFGIIHLQKQSKNIPLNSAEILFCVEGDITVLSVGKEICLKKGESVFVGYCLGNYQLSGSGVIARAYC